jgi:hypothetical protein
LDEWLVDWLIKLLTYNSPVLQDEGQAIFYLIFYHLQFTEFATSRIFGTF